MENLPERTKSHTRVTANIFLITHEVSYRLHVEDRTVIECDNCLQRL